MKTAIFDSAYLRDNFFSIKQQLRDTPFGGSARYYEIEPVLLSGIVAGDNAQSKGVTPDDFDSIITMLEHHKYDMADYIACKLGLAIGYFESLDAAVNHVVSEDDHYYRLANYLSSLGSENEVSYQDMKQKPVDISLAMTLIESYSSNLLI